MSILEKGKEIEIRIIPITFTGTNSITVQVPQFYLGCSCILGTKLISSGTDGKPYISQNITWNANEQIYEITFTSNVANDNGTYHLCFCDRVANTLEQI